MLLFLQLNHRPYWANLWLEIIANNRFINILIKNLLIRIVLSESPIDIQYEFLSQPDLSNFYRRISPLSSQEIWTLYFVENAAY